MTALPNQQARERRQDEITPVAKEAGFTAGSFRVQFGAELPIADYRQIADRSMSSALTTRLMHNVCEAQIPKTVYFLHRGPFYADSCAWRSLTPCYVWKTD